MTFRSATVFAILSTMNMMAFSQSEEIDFLAYAQTEVGDYPLPEKIEDLIADNAKNFVKLRWGAYAGPKTPIAILQAKNTTKIASYEEEDSEGNASKDTLSKSLVPLQSIETMVTDTMVGCGRFLLVERDLIGDMRNEQKLERTGETTPESGPKKGRMLAHKYMLKTVVTEYEPNYKGGGAGLSLKGVNLGGGKRISMVGMTFRLIDSQSSIIIWSRQIQVLVAAKAIGGSGRDRGKGVGGYSYNKSPIGNAVRIAINYGVFELIKELGDQPLTGLVAAIIKKQIVVNLGKDMVSEGMVLNAVTKGEEFTDPATGLSLGGDDEVIGTLRVDKVRDKFSFCTPDGFEASELVVGDKVYSEKGTSTIRYATAWELKPKKKFNPFKHNRNKKKKKRAKELEEQRARAHETGENP